MFVFTAIDAQIALTERRIHEMAMMGLVLIRMSERSEEAASDAHALDGNSVLLLKVPDHLDEGEQKRLMRGREKAIMAQLGLGREDTEE